MSYLDSLEIECLRHALRAAVQRAEAAEAKLAELEKQEPVVWCNENDLKLMVNKRMIGGMMTVRHHGERPLFTRPAPALSLAELLEVTKAAFAWIDAVPPETMLPVMPGIDRDWADSVLRNIEEAK